MKILVTGSKGQVGQEFKKASASLPDHFIFTDIDSLDITNETALASFLKSEKPELLINCAAYTAVDLAEAEKELAFKVNGDAVQSLATLCKQNNIFLIHLSTDYVFDGKKSSPYTEEDVPYPLNVYGESKLKGEQSILSAGGSAAIIRTSWLYSSYGNNFVNKIILLAEKQSILNVISDQIGCPTSAPDLVHAILPNLEKFLSISTPQIFHFTNEGSGSWYEFALEILRKVKPLVRVQAISSSEFPQAAKRPNFSAMKNEKIKKLLNIEIPHWKASLASTLTNLGY